MLGRREGGRERYKSKREKSGRGRESGIGGRE
jgi:hypothetical protein